MKAKDNILFWGLRFLTDILQSTFNLPLKRTQLKGRFLPDAWYCVRFVFRERCSRADAIRALSADFGEMST